MTIRGHFNGTSIVLDEPADLPLNEALELEVKRQAGVSPEVAAAMKAAKDPAEIARRLAALESLRQLSANDPVIPLELLRREHLYD